MSTLPEVRDAADAAELVRELFHNPPQAALDLAATGDASGFDAALRYLRVALNDLPPGQAALLREGMALLLRESELTGYLIVLLEDGGATAGDAAAAVVSEGTLRGLPAVAGGDGDLHALLLGLCARLGGRVPAAALARDVADPRYRALALFMLASADLGALSTVLPAIGTTLAVDDDYAIEALGRALHEALQAHGAGAVLAAIPAGDAAVAPVVLAAMQEALSPARVLLLSPEQQEQRHVALFRLLEERPENDYARLSTDPIAAEAFTEQVRQRLGAGR